MSTHSETETRELRLLVELVRGLIRLLVAWVRDAEYRLLLREAFERDKYESDGYRADWPR